MFDFIPHLYENHNKKINLIYKVNTVLDEDEIKSEGNIKLPTGESVTLPGENENHITVKPGTEGEAPTINKDGNVIVPEGGKVNLPNIGEVTVPSGSIVKPNGTIEYPNGETIINPDGTVTVQGTNGDSVTVPLIQTEEGSIILPEVNGDGDITLPNGGIIKLPGNEASITIPNGSTINSEGNIQVPTGGANVDKGV